MKRVSGTVGSKCPSSSDLPFPVRFAAMYPAFLSYRKRLSASVTALGSAGSNSWRVSPVVSITMWVLIESSCGFVNHSIIRAVAPIAHRIEVHRRHVYEYVVSPMRIPT
jgi:hypothetical protein